MNSFVIWFCKSTLLISKQPQVDPQASTVSVSQTIMSRFAPQMNYLKTEFTTH